LAFLLTRRADAARLYSLLFAIISCFPFPLSELQKAPTGNCVLMKKSFSFLRDRFRQQEEVVLFPTHTFFSRHPVPERDGLRRADEDPPSPSHVTAFSLHSFS